MFLIYLQMFRNSMLQGMFKPVGREDDTINMER
jgi:hypothetical protein